MQPTTTSRGPSQARPDRAAAVYGLVSIAVVAAAEKDVEHPRDLALAVAGYTVALWVAHAYAVVVASGRDEGWISSLRSERPILFAGVPAVLGASGAAVVGASTLAAARAAVLLSGVALVTLQIWILRDARHPTRRILATVGVDVCSAAFVAWLLLAVK